MAIVASDGPTDMPSIASGRSSTASSVVFSVSREIAYALEQRRVVALTLSAAASVSASFETALLLLENGWASDGRCIVCTTPHAENARRACQLAESRANADRFSDGAISGPITGAGVFAAVTPFEGIVRSQTRLVFATDEWLLREAARDPLLGRYSIVIVDGAIERSIATDLLLALFKKITRRRPELRLLLILPKDLAQPWIDYFKGAKNAKDCNNTRDAKSDLIDKSIGVALGDASDDIAVISPKEPQNEHPVDIMYLTTPSESLVDSAVDATISALAGTNTRDVVIFLSSAREVAQCAQKLRQRLLHAFADSNTAVIALGVDDSSICSGGCSSLGDEDADLDLFSLCSATVGAEAVDDLGALLTQEVSMRRVLCVPSTEQALPLAARLRPTVVIDGGIEQFISFDGTREEDTRMATSLEQADRRMRIAGSCGSGKCLRLFTAQTFAKLRAQPLAAVQRRDLTTAVLLLRYLGIENLLRFEWLHPPAAEPLARALEQLRRHGALDSRGALTAQGMSLASLPLDARQARLLLTSNAYGCSASMASLLAMTVVGRAVDEAESESTRVAWWQRDKFAACEGDHLTLINMLESYLRASAYARWCREKGLKYEKMARAAAIRTWLLDAIKQIAVREQDVLAQDAEKKIAELELHDETSRLLWLILSMYPENIARQLPDGRYRLLRDDESEATRDVHFSSVLRGRAIATGWIVFTGTKNGRLALCSQVQQKWISHVVNMATS